jgi:hypothetical protein
MPYFSLQQEISALSRISHQNVIKLVGYVDADEYFALVYERAQQDLEGYKRKLLFCISYVL